PRAVATASPAQRARAAALTAALGGAGNVLRVEPVAATRLRAELRDAGAMDEGALARDGAAAMRVAPDVVHLVVGADSEALAAAMAGG
ncbi:PTS transporter subunit EIIB, partial [Roseisolibacter sp. H3M3-2]